MNNKSCIFIGNPVPKKFILETENENCSIADNIAQNNLIEGLYEHYGERLRVITVAANFSNPKILNRKTSKCAVYLDCGVEAIGVGNLNYNKVVYYLSIIFTYTLELFKCIKKLKANKKKVIIISSGPYIFTSIPIFLAKCFYKICFIPFLIGSVELPDYSGLFKLISKCSPKMLKMADATITYVEKSSIDYTKKPFISILYSLDKEKISLFDVFYSKDSKIENEKYTILYTGALTKIKGADKLIEIIKYTNDKYKWQICGDGEFKDEIKVLSDDNTYDVEYYGVVNSEKISKLQFEADLLIAFQSVETEVYKYYSKYAASGKLIEYLLSGTPILTPDIENISKDIRPYLNFFENQSKEKIEEAIDMLKDKKVKGVIHQKAKKGREYVLKNANNKNQNQRITNFIEKVCEEFSESK